MTKPIIISPISTKPVPPADDDCCGGGACSPCVWDQHYADLKKWQQQTESPESPEIIVESTQNPLQKIDTTYR